MSMSFKRLLVGFGAGFLSHLVIEGALGAGLYAAGVIPALPWSLAPVGSLGVPQSLSLAFWAGLFGVVYVLMEPWLTARFGQWPGGLFYGFVVPLFCDWFIVLPLKGRGIGGGFHPASIPVDVALNAALGIGAVVLFWFGLALVEGRSSASPKALHG